MDLLNALLAIVILALAVFITFTMFALYVRIALFIYSLLWRLIGPVFGIDQKPPTKKMCSSCSCRK
jgi:hypothetical protein